MDLVNVRVHKWRLIRKIGSGSFGEIYLAEHHSTHEEVAVKVEPINTKCPQLVYESRVNKILAGGVGIPNVRWTGVQADHNIMVMDLLGPSLEDVFCRCNRRLGLKSTLLLAEQMLARVQYMHSKSLIHRDIKPDNFIIGRNKKANQVYIIDFGLSKRYRDPKTHQHIAYRENKSLTGTARYASVNCLLGIEPSRRDDLESLGYVYMYFLRGSLPWQGLKARTQKEKYRKICEKKQSTPVEVLCEGYPEEFQVYLNYCKGLQFDDTPDYNFLHKLLRELFELKGFVRDDVFDWTAPSSNNNNNSSSNGLLRLPSAAHPQSPSASHAAQAAASQSSGMPKLPVLNANGGRRVSQGEQQQQQQAAPVSADDVSKTARLRAAATAAQNA